MAKKSRKRTAKTKKRKAPKRTAKRAKTAKRGKAKKKAAAPRPAKRKTSRKRAAKKKGVVATISSVAQGILETIEDTQEMRQKMAGSGLENS